MRFPDRRAAGRLLGRQLEEFAGRADVLVLALPRGGVPVACEIARTLAAPLDVFVVRKLGVPGQEELAMGAIATGGVRVLNGEVVRALEISPDQIEEIAEREERERQRRELAYRGLRGFSEIEGRTVILVDDGLATGSTMRAAVAALRRLSPQQIVIAVPVGARSTCDSLALDADRVVCLHSPPDLFSVGEWYADFAQTTDQEVRQLLEEAAQARAAAAEGRADRGKHDAAT
jgi:putative phosphoribosyl transferase